MPEISIRAEELFHLGPLAVTNALLLSTIAVLLLAAIGFALRRSLAPVPGRLQSIVELFIEQGLGLMDTLFGSRHLSVRYFPLIATVFLFILISNWLGLLPGIGSIGLYQEHDGHRVLVPLFRAPAADLNFTLALAVISVFATNILGVTAIGFFRHFGKFFTLQSPILTFAGILEFISEFVKIISFSFRLFGNVFAGEVLLTIVGFLVPYFIPLPFLFLEIFVGFVQALIFSMLTLVFIASAVREDAAHH
ncbi:ATP synthase F0 subunit A [Candidatus Parcubacteria bacterium]|nr:MAG: ATP synthase F0 subunit A [Candidatus Parcubacteria bacterium]